MAGTEHGKVGRRRALATACLLAIVVFGQPRSPLLLATNPEGTNGGYVPYSSNSWALGLVVPQGAQLAGGSKVEWQDVNNVTARVQLPEINRTDGIVYVVLSVMASDSSVLQVAAGIYPGSSSWLVYSEFVTDVSSIPPSYHSILNSSEPSFLPGATVTLSIFRSPSGNWALRVQNVNTNLSVQRDFPLGASTPLMAGDQEVLALESFSRTGAVFEGMRNLTLQSTFIDGRTVDGGYYPYNGWSTDHDPLFAVGGYGPSPPGFISLEQGRNDSYVWSYSGGWVQDSAPQLAVPVGMIMVALLLGSLGAVYLALRVLTKKRDSGNSVMENPKPKG